MKKKLTHNLFLKILSVVFAIMLWILVAIVTDPYKTVIISGVPITIINEEEITGQGLGQIYSVVSPQNSTVSIKVYGQRSKVDNLTAADMKATVDFGEISSVGAAYISITELDGVTVLSKTPEMMKIEVDPLVEKTFDVVANIVGNAASSFIVDSYELSPDTMTIIAPESVMAKLARAQVVVDIGGMAADIKTTEKIALYDASGKVVNYEKEEHMQVSDKVVDVHVKAYMVKEVPVTIETAGALGDDYKLMGVSGSLESVTIKGPKIILDEIHSINLTEESKVVDITGLTGSRDIMVDMSQFLPGGVTFVDEAERLITVSVTIAPILEKTLTIPMSAVSMLNLAENLEISKEAMVGSFTVKLRGLEEDLANVNVNALAPYVNLKGCTQVVNSCRVYFSLPTGVTLSENVKINVVLRAVVEDVIGEVTDDTTGGETEETTGGTSNGTTGETTAAGTGQ